MDRPRILVARAPLREPGSSVAAVPPCTVGVLPWSVSSAWLSVVVKASFAFDLVTSDAPQVLRLVPPPRLHAGGLRDEREPSAGLRVDDFVPRRPYVDLTVVGSVEVVPLPSGALVERSLALGLGERLAQFVLAPQAAGPAPLRPPALREVGSAEPAFIGPRPSHDGSLDDFVHDDDFDLVGYQAAHPRLAFHPKLAEGQPIVLSGVALDGGTVRLAPPPVAPRALFDWSRPGPAPLDVPLALEGYEVDLERRVVDVAWRGFAAVEPPAHDDVDRLVIVWAEVSEWRARPGAAWAHGLRELPRGAFQWAVDREDAVRGEEPPPLDEHELTMARYESWDQVLAPEPEMPLPRYARIHAELGAAGDEREAVFTRNGITAYDWSVEERAWAQKVATPPSSTDADPGTADGVAFGEALAAAEDELAREKALPPDAIARLAVRVERTDPRKPLEHAKLSLGAFLSLERRAQAQADADPAVRTHMERAREDEERLVEEEEARAEREARDEDDAAPAAGDPGGGR